MSVRGRVGAAPATGAHRVKRAPGHGLAAVRPGQPLLRTTQAACGGRSISLVPGVDVRRGSRFAAPTAMRALGAGGDCPARADEATCA